jgi:hypothetical protein
MSLPNTLSAFEKIQAGIIKNVSADSSSSRADNLHLWLSNEKRKKARKKNLNKTKHTHHADESIG